MRSFGIIHDDRCVAAGVDPDTVDRVARRLVQVCRDAERLGLSVSGSMGTIALSPVGDPRHPVLSRVYPSSVENQDAP